MNDFQMKEFIISNGWLEIQHLYETRYWHPQYSRLESFSLKEAYKYQRSIERKEDCGCS